LNDTASLSLPAGPRASMFPRGFLRKINYHHRQFSFNDPVLPNNKTVSRNLIRKAWIQLAGSIERENSK
jgi:hypothetical protein